VIGKQEKVEKPIALLKTIQNKLVYMLRPIWQSGPYVYVVNRLQNFIEFYSIFVHFKPQLLFCGFKKQHCGL
jgi:hypothetical protein